jgi:hypothetical protein
MANEYGVAIAIQGLVQGDGIGDQRAEPIAAAGIHPSHAPWLDRPAVRLSRSEDSIPRRAIRGRMPRRRG